MDWFPAVFIVFKAIVLATGMFFAVKWHYNKGRKGKETAERGAMLRAAGMALAAFVLLLLALLLLAFGLGRMLGLDLPFP